MNNTDTLVTFAATTRATRFWTGIDAAGHVAQFWTKEPDPADHPALAITAHAIIPLGANQAAVGWEPVDGVPVAVPGMPTRLQFHRAGYGEGVRTAAKLCEGLGLETLAAQIRDLQSTAPVLAPVRAAQEGWQKNTGTQPVADDVLVSIIYACGSTDTDVAGNYVWEIDTDSMDVAYYHVLPAAPAPGSGS